MSAEKEHIVNSGNVDDIITDMITHTPDIQPHIIDDVNKESIKSPKENSVKKDTFNPDYHMSNPDGSPKLTKTGKFRKKTGAKLVNPYENEAPVDTGINPILMNSRAAAEVVQNLKRTAYNNFLGCIYGDDRHNIYIDTTTNYFVASGGVKLTPLHTLLLLEGALFIEAMSKPKAIDKVTKFKIWIAEKYLNFKRRKKNGAQSYNRANNERENDFSETPG